VHHEAGFNRFPQAYVISNEILAAKVAEWTIAHMQHRTAYFYYHRYSAVAKRPMQNSRKSCRLEGSVSAPYPHVLAVAIGMTQNRRNPFALKTFSEAREGFGRLVETWADFFDGEGSWSAKEY
jgi:hypothetical protein